MQNSFLTSIISSTHKGHANQTDTLDRIQTSSTTQQMKRMTYIWRLDILYSINMFCFVSNYQTMVSVWIYTYHHTFAFKVIIYGSLSGEKYFSVLLLPLFFFFIYVPPVEIYVTRMFFWPLDEIIWTICNR